PRSTNPSHRRKQRSNKLPLTITKLTKLHEESIKEEGLNSFAMSSIQNDRYSNLIEQIMNTTIGVWYSDP
ncbi:MAG: hypothetical protein QW534_11140, partial [Candidatus Methanomethylicia archaeon]